MFKSSAFVTGLGVLLKATLSEIKDSRLIVLNPSFDQLDHVFFFTTTLQKFLVDRTFRYQELRATIRAHRAMRAAGVEADLNVYEGVSQAEFLIFTDLPESAEVFTKLGAFLDEHLK
ncbi:MAG: hypothetical protein JKY99_01965 [Rhizobiales bacterium]|nr:hypothetical protein [Hyphomicrobiales bacterium]